MRCRHYGAGLARYLSSQKITVVKVDRPDRRTRRVKGKSDPIDALAAARADLSGQGGGMPKTRTGPVEAIRALRVARNGAVKARTAAINQLHGLLTAAPEDLRADLARHTGVNLVNRCAGLTIDDTRPSDPAEATKAALTAIATHVQALTAEIPLADRRLRPAVPKPPPPSAPCSASDPTSPVNSWPPSPDNPSDHQAGRTYTKCTVFPPRQPTAPGGRCIGGCESTDRVLHGANPGMFFDLADSDSVTCCHCGLYVCVGCETVPVASTLTFCDACP